MALSSHLGMPSFPSRIAHSTSPTPERVAQVSAGERALAELGFSSARVRWHHTESDPEGLLPVARIEVPLERRFEAYACREALGRALTRAGFARVTLDICGLRHNALLEVWQGQQSTTAVSFASADEGEDSWSLEVLHPMVVVQTTPFEALHLLRDPHGAASRLRAVSEAVYAVLDITPQPDPLEAL